MDKHVGEFITKEMYPEIYEWLSKNIIGYKINQRRFTLTSEGKINAYCNVSLCYNIKEIKYPFSYVGGYFDCSGCENLTSLIGSPEKVNGNFNCSSCNNIISLDGAPKKIGMVFSCENCKKLISFIGFPKEVGGYFYIANNNFSNDPKQKERYNLYVNMWFELLENITNDDRNDYMKNYKDKKRMNNPIIPIEVITMVENELKIKKILENE